LRRTIVFGALPSPIWPSPQGKCQGRVREQPIWMFWIEVADAVENVPVRGPALL
jgi:hypothetical protein